jgi:hypothetical protein
MDNIKVARKKIPPKINKISPRKIKRVTQNGLKNFPQKK